MSSIDLRLSAALRSPAFDRPVPADLAPRVLAALGAAGAAPRRFVRLRALAPRAAALWMFGLASFALGAWCGALRPGAALRWGAAGGDKPRAAAPGATVPCLAIAVPCAGGATADEIEERILGPLGRLARRNGWVPRESVPALGTLAHGAFRDRGGVLLVPLDPGADAAAILALAREKTAVLAETFPAFARPPAVTLQAFPIPAPDAATASARAIADALLLEASPP